MSLSSVNKVTPVDKTSIVLTLILSSIFFKERITLYKIVSIVFMLFGTYLMVGKSDKENNNKYLVIAVVGIIMAVITLVMNI